MMVTAVSTACAAFLCTYLAHALVIQLPVWWLTAGRLRPRNPVVRVQLLQLSLVVPLVTSIAVTPGGGPHWGLQLVLGQADSESLERAATTESGAGIRGTEREAAEVAAGPEMRSLPDVGRVSVSADSRTDVADGRGVQSARAAAGGASVSAAPVGVGGMYSVAAAWLWLILAAAGCLRLLLRWRGLQRLRRAAREVTDSELRSELNRLAGRFGIRREVALLESSETEMPLAAGLISPFVLLPARETGSREEFGMSEYSAMLAHELAHVARRDAWWNLFCSGLNSVFFFQPMNRLISRELRRQMDFSADAMAADVLGERMSLVSCLFAAGQRLRPEEVPRPSGLALASGMSLFRSVLGQRVEALLQSDEVPSPARQLSGVSLLSLMLVSVLVVSLLAPRAVSDSTLSFSSAASSLSVGNQTMSGRIVSLLVLAGLVAPAPAQDQEPSVAAEAAEKLSTVPDELPEGIRRFNGMLVGRLAAKDTEHGTFTVRVDAVPRVWQNSKAENPRSVVGKTIRVSGVSGRFLDVLVVARIGETIEFECKHDGDGLVFPGELLRKVAPYSPEDYPVLPENFRGFRGQVAAEVLKKDPETFELILRVNSVLRTWEENSAKEPKSIEGRSLMLAGFWNRRDAYHELKVGDRIEVGMKHISVRSDHMTVAEEIRRTVAAGDGPSERGRGAMEREGRMEREGQAMEGRGLHRGFRGMLVGRLVEKDAERGTFTITVNAVPRVWENNKARNPKALIGQNVAAEGVHGRMIDALVVAKIGDTIEFGALHEEGPRVRVGEVLRKVAPVRPGDYPVLPDDFRGFRGMVTCKVVRKGDELWELIVEVEEIHESFDGSRAKRPEAVIGKEMMLAGFWNRKDDFHRVRVGDRIRCGMIHTQILSDHLSVAEGIRKVDGPSRD